MAHRIKKVLSDVTNSNQTVFFLHGRHIGDNIRQVLETIEHYEKAVETRPAIHSCL